MVIKEVSYEIPSRLWSCRSSRFKVSGADVLLIAATPKFAAQAIRKTFDIGWTPVRYMTDVSNRSDRDEACSLKKSKGVITGVYGKDPTDARWKDDPGFKGFAAFIEKYMTPKDLMDANAINGFGLGADDDQVLKQCDNDLSRANIMKQAAKPERSRTASCCCRASRSTHPPRITARSASCSSRISMARAGNLSGSY